MKVSTKCPACQAVYPSGAARCEKCGEPLPPTCVSCGSPVEEGEDLCPSCRDDQGKIAAEPGFDDDFEEVGNLDDLLDEGLAAAPPAADADADESDLATTGPKPKAPSLGDAGDDEPTNSPKPALLHLDDDQARIPLPPPTHFMGIPPTGPSDPERPAPADDEAVVPVDDGMVAHAAAVSEDPAPSSPDEDLPTPDPAAPTEAPVEPPADQVEPPAAPAALAPSPALPSADLPAHAAPTDEETAEPAPLPPPPIDAVEEPPTPVPSLSALATVAAPPIDETEEPPTPLPAPEVPAAVEEAAAPAAPPADEEDIGLEPPLGAPARTAATDGEAGAASPADLAADLAGELQAGFRAQVLARIQAKVRAEVDVAQQQPRPDDGKPEFEIEADFVGRVEILERLQGVFGRAARERRLQFAALTGPSGIGKTRLAQELAETVSTQFPEARPLTGVCGGPGSPAFASFARLFCGRFGIAKDEDPARARDKISKGVEALLPSSRSTEVAHLLSYLVGIPFPESPILEPLIETPTQLEARVFIAIRRFLAADAERTPLLLILDQVERATPETINLTHYLVAGLEDHAVMLLAVGRPNLYEVHPTFGAGDVQLERFELGPLSDAESAHLLTELVRPVGAPPPLDLRQHAIDSFGGVPRAYFELVRYLLETSIIRCEPFQDGPEAVSPRLYSWRFNTQALAEANLPTTFEEVLAARLAALPDEERGLLDKAAVCGEAFWLDALVALVRMDRLKGNIDGPSVHEIEQEGERTREEVRRKLAALEERGLIERAGHSTIPGETEYRFAYPPWWDVVYDRIPPAERRLHHRRISQWLELRPEGRGEESQEEIGAHLERAGEGQAAGQRFRLAAEAARSRYLNDKAIRLFARALSCLDPDDLATRIGIWHDIGSVHQTKGDHESALSAFERMLRLTWLSASHAKAAVAYNKLGRVYRQMGNLPVALDYLQRGLETFERIGDHRGVAGSSDDLGQVLWLLGRYDEALDRSAAALEQRRRLGDRRSIASSLINIGHIERHRGLFDEAAACYNEAVELCRAAGDRAGMAQCLNGLGMLAFQRGDLDVAHQTWQDALAVAEKIGALPLQAAIEGHLGDVARAAGNVMEARSHFERSDQVARNLDDRRLQSESTRNLSLVALHDGDTARARDLCHRALEIAKLAGIPVNVGRALVALGEVHAATLFDDATAGQVPAEEYFQQGVDLFRRIRNDAELAVALERFGKYHLERGNNPAARELLSEARGIYLRLGMKASEHLERVLNELE